MGTEGLEPSTSAMWGQHSNQLSYVPLKAGTELRPIMYVRCQVLRIPTGHMSLDTAYAWAFLDSNQGPIDYESTALTDWAMGPKFYLFLNNLGKKIL